MKNIYTLFFFVLLSASSFAQNYSVFLSPYFRESMTDIFFTDDQYGWLCGYEGMIMKTTDGGSSWVEQNSGVYCTLKKIEFRSQTLGYIAADSCVLKTTDGGNTWTRYDFYQLVPSIAFNLCDAVRFLDDNTGFVIAGQVKNIYLLKTYDGGVTWTIKDSLKTTDNTYRWYDLDFRGTNGVMVSSKKNQQKYTTNSGENWTLSTPIVDALFGMQKAVRFINNTDVISMGEGNEFNGVPIPLYKSYNGGLTWTKKNQSVAACYERVKDAYFKSELEVIGVGSNGFSKAFVITTSDSGSTWTTSVADYAFGLQSVSGNGNTVWALGSSSHIIKSTDFGTTWNLSPFTVPSSIYSIKCFDNRGYALTRNGDVYLSPDGLGNSWQYLSNTGQNDAYDMFFTDSNTGFILKENRHIVKTTDGGLTWRSVLTAVPFSSRNKVGGITFADANNGYAWFSLNDYGEYHVFKSSDAGETWNEVLNTGGPGYISGDVVFFDSNTGVLLGPDRWVMRTTDGGITWTPGNTNNFPAGFENKDFEGVALLNENKAIAIGDAFICVTTDKGLNWEYINHNIGGIDSSFYTISFKDENNGFVGQYNGVILQTTDGGSNWTVDSSMIDQYYLFSSAYNKQGKILFGTSTGQIIGDNTISGLIADGGSTELTFSLSQNYPNPFNPSTTIEYTLREKSEITIKIFDVIGNEVSQLVNGTKPAGTYRINFNAAHLPSGVYFCRMNSGSFSESRKLILIK